MLQALFQKAEEKNERNLFPLGRRSDVSGLFFFVSFPSMRLPRARLQVGTCKKRKEKKNVYVLNLKRLEVHVGVSASCSSLRLNTWMCEKRCQRSHCAGL